MAAGPEPSLQLGFGQEVEGPGRFAEEDYSTLGQKVKGMFKGAFKPSSALRHSAYLAKFARKQRDDCAGFAELNDAEDESGSLFRSGHDG